MNFAKVSRANSARSFSKRTEIPCEPLKKETKDWVSNNLHRYITLDLYVVYLFVWSKKHVRNFVSILIFSFVTFHTKNEQIKTNYPATIVRDSNAFSKIAGSHSVRRQNFLRDSLPCSEISAASVFSFLHATKLTFPR
jgi:hypothetical protein